MNKNSIIVVGSGATALSFLYSLLANAAHRTVCPYQSIYVIEKRRFKGRGLAYDLDLDTNLLNTRAGFITPFADKPGHFFDWLIANRSTWQDEFPDLEVSADTFVPRPLFGLYLEYMMSDLAGQFAAIGMELVQMRGEAVEIHRPALGRSQVKTDGGLSIEADHIVLCCGNLQSREYRSLATNPGFFTSPYPIRNLARAAAGKSSVAILGARLSAVDVALGLAASGFKGQMVMFSRSGYFPSVRGTQGRYAASILTLSRLREHHDRHGHLRLSQVLEWTMQELALAGSPVNPLDQLPPAPPEDVAAYLESEIQAARGERLWQAVLYATNTVIDYLWQILHEEDRILFMRHYAAAWMSYRVSIPVENACRLLDLARSGQLTFRRGAAVASAHPEGGFTVGTQDDGSSDGGAPFDMVVGAFGTPRNASLLDSHLIQSLLSSGLADAHPHGGLVVDAQTGALIDKTGTPATDISVLGELTSGVHFFTSVLEINARHAARLANRIVQTPLATSAGPKPAALDRAAALAAAFPLHQPSAQLQ